MPVRQELSNEALEMRRADGAPASGDASAVLLALELAEGGALDADALGSVDGSVELLEGPVDGSVELLEGPVDGSVELLEGPVDGSVELLEGPVNGSVELVEGSVVGSLDADGAAGEVPEGVPGTAVEFPLEPRPPSESVREATSFDTAQSMTSSMQASTNAGSVLLVPDDAPTPALAAVAFAAVELGSEPMTIARM